MLWRQCWCQKCFQWGPGERNQMAAVTGEHGCLLVQWSAVQNCWAGCGRGESLAAGWRSLQRGTGCELSPGAAVTLCPVASPRAQPHHRAALALIHASSGAFHLQIWARLHCLFSSGLSSVPGNYEVSFWYLSCLDLYRLLFSRWLLNSWGFLKTWWPGVKRQYICRLKCLY